MNPSQEKILHFENCYPKINPVVVDGITEVNQLEAYIHKHYPQISPEYIGFRFSAHKNKCIGVPYLTGDIPSSVREIYTFIYLKKHPPIPIKLNKSTQLH